MEQIIIIIVLAIVSSFFKKGKGKTEGPAKGQSKPFTATGRVPDNPQSKLKEMSKELYRELQKEMQRQDVEPPSRQLQQTPVTPTVVAPQPSVVPEVATPARARVERAERSTSSREQRGERQRGRLSAHGGQRQSASSMQTHELVPKNEQDLLKGIVFSEILGPPKSKR